jgi:hypothetical protein
MDRNDGGPAFPIPIAGCSDGSVYNAMEQSSGKLGGMTLRDYFAAKAMQGQIVAGADEEMRGHPQWRGEFAREAYRFADAMLAERAKERT